MFLYDPIDETISFQNRATRMIVSEMLAKELTKKKERFISQRRGGGSAESIP